MGEVQLSHHTLSCNYCTHESTIRGWGLVLKTSKRTGIQGKRFRTTSGVPPSLYTKINSKHHFIHTWIRMLSNSIRLSIEYSTIYTYTTYQLSQPDRQGRDLYCSGQSCPGPRNKKSMLRIKPSLCSLRHTTLVMNSNLSTYISAINHQQHIWTQGPSSALDWITLN